MIKNILLLKKIGIIFFIFFISTTVMADKIILKSGAEINVKNTWKDGGELKCNMYGSVVSFDLNEVERVEVDKTSNIESSTKAEPKSNAKKSHFNAGNTSVLRVWVPDPSSKSYPILRDIKTVTLKKNNEKNFIEFLYTDGSGSQDEIVWKSKTRFEKINEERGEYFRLIRKNLGLYDEEGLIDVLMWVR